MATRQAPRLRPRPAARPAPRRLSLRAFTLVEVLVVVALVGVLVALLLPAVHAARGSARRTACLSNLHQLGVAAALYADGHGKYPAGGWIPHALEPGFRSMNTGWSAALLPYLEQPRVYELLNVGLAYSHRANETASGQVLGVYLCPAQPRQAARHAGMGDPFPSAESDYGGMYGPRGIPDRFSRNDPPRGAFVYWECFAPRDIVDGLSSTLFFGESAGGLNALWASGRNVFDQAAAINARPPSEFGQELASAHPGGVQAAFGDGAARFLADTLDLRVLAALCTRADADRTDGAW
jgi:prepilin-type N-terminal cleavage/methylation domain-containing protein